MDEVNFNILKIKELLCVPQTKLELQTKTGLSHRSINRYINRIKRETNIFEFFSPSGFKSYSLNQIYPSENHQKNVPINYEIKSLNPEKNTTTEINTGISLTVDEHDVWQMIKNKGMTIGELSRQLRAPIGVSKQYIYQLLDSLRNKGFDCKIDEAKKEVTLEKNISEIAKPLELEPLYKHRVRFGLLSDTHYGSICQQPSLVQTAYKIFDEEKVDFVIHTGDMVEGRGLYRGQDQEIFLHSADEQKDYTVEHYPYRKNYKTYVIAGSHDLSFKKIAGYNILRHICESRDDLVFKGEVGSHSFLIKKLTLEALHPSGGVPYARCFDENTELLTKRGWTTYKDISLSDEIATKNPETEKLEYQHPEELFIKNYIGPMYHFKTRTVDQFVTPDHSLWLSKYNDGKKENIWKRIKAQDLNKISYKKYYMSMTAKWIGQELDYITVPFHSWAGARDLGKMPMDNFLSFLGWFIAEGNVSNGKVVNITQKQGKNSDQIIEKMQKIGLHVKTYVKDKNRTDILSIRGYNASLCRWLNAEVGHGAKNKRVPRFIMELSKRQIKIFLDSLFAGDGWKSKNSQKRFDLYKSVSSGLLADIQELALKTGKAATIHSKDCLTILDQNEPVTPKPKVVEYSGVIWCVSVPNGVIYTRRNGKPVWTGNSWRLQKVIEGAMGDIVNRLRRTKDFSIIPHLLFIGHLHVANYTPYLGVDGFMIPCLQSQTPYLLGKGYSPELGIFIINVECDDDWNINKLIFEHRKFNAYVKENDY